MDEQYKSNPNHVIHLAKELTIVAMQNNMIRASVDPSESASNVSKFYRTILETINED